MHTIDMNNYKKGANRERQALKLLREQGYYAERTAGSHGVADIIALKAGEKARLIQVKCTKSKWSGFGPEDRELLKQMGQKANAQVELLWWPTDGKGPRYIPSNEWPKTTT